MRVWLVGVLLVLVAGCAGNLPGPERPAEVTFTLESLPRVAPATEAFRCRTLLISPVQSAPGYATSRMAYVEQAYRIDYFANHRWADTPARMLAPLLRQTLERSAAFGGVVMAPTPADADVRLDTKVLTFRQAFRDAGSGVMQVALDVSLVGVENGKLLGTRTLEAALPALERSPYGGAVAANQATEQVLADLLSYVLQRMRDSGLTCPKRTPAKR